MPSFLKPVWICSYVLFAGKNIWTIQVIIYIFQSSNCQTMSGQSLLGGYAIGLYFQGHFHLQVKVLYLELIIAWWHIYIFATSILHALSLWVSFSHSMKLSYSVYREGNWDSER